MSAPPSRLPKAAAARSTGFAASSRRAGSRGKSPRAFKEILADETAHRDAGGRSLDGLVTSRAAFLRAARIITEVSSQRLRMRNEQFGFPLSEAQLKALEPRPGFSLGAQGLSNAGYCKHPSSRMADARNPKLEIRTILNARGSKSFVRTRLAFDVAGSFLLSV